MLYDHQEIKFNKKKIFLKISAIEHLKTRNCCVCQGRRLALPTIKDFYV